MQQKIWFITGASSGLGKALAEEVITSGDFAIATFRQQTQADAFNNLHKENALGLVMDVTKTAEVHKVVQTVQEKFGRVDFLVNNAGVGFAGAIEEASTKEIRDVFEANFFGVWELTKAFLPLFRQQKCGHIFQISSQAGFKAVAGFGVYNASKFALEGFSEALAQEIAPLGVKLTIVEPGPFRTNFAGSSLIFAKTVIDDYNSTAGAFRERMKTVDGKQEGDPKKAAQAIIQIAHSGEAPLRMPLGKIALATIASKIESVQKDLEAGKERAEKAVF